MQINMVKLLTSECSTKNLDKRFWRYVNQLRNVYAVLVPAEFLVPVVLLVAGAAGARGDAQGGREDSTKPRICRNTDSKFETQFITACRKSYKGKLF